MELVDRVLTERGELVLRRDGRHFEIVSNGVFLMDTRDGRSERLLATAALDRHPAPASVLVGGLGVGFTLAAVLADPRVARVTVVEREAAVVRWQQAGLDAYSGHALSDPRVTVEVADLVGHLTAAEATYDVACIDVDNGPDWTVTEDNDRLYGVAGTALVHRRLAPGGVLTVWASRPVPAYVDLLATAFAEVEVLDVPVERGEPDVVVVALCSRGHPRTRARDGTMRG